MEGPNEISESGDESRFCSGRILLSAKAFRFAASDTKSPVAILVSEGKLFIASRTGLLREIPLLEIDALTLSETSSEFVVHLREGEDERLSCTQNRREVVQILLRLKTRFDEPKVSVYFVRDLNLDLYVTTEEDLKEGHLLRPSEGLRELIDCEGFTRREERSAQIRKSQRDSTKTLYTASKKQVSIDDFELLKTLGKGAHGKVLLCELKGGKGELFAMKILKKSHIIEAKQLEHTKAENLILSYVSHPFLVSLKAAFQTDHKIYFVMEFMKGGELFQHLKRVFQFTEEQTKFIAACLVLALGHLHNSDYIYRDLKPENVMLDERGYAKLTDFGLAKSLKVQDVAKTFCGTPEYLSPEVILDKGCNRPADWWSLGILVYEMIFGIPPFYSQNIQTMYKNTIMNPLKFKKDTRCSEEAKDFISGLLTKQPDKRLGSIADSLEVMSHPWFKDFDFFNLIEKKLKPPFNPSPSDGNWVRNFDPEFTKQTPSDSICFLDPKVLEEFRSDFAEFNYHSSDVEVPRTGETSPSQLKMEQEEELKTPALLNPSPSDPNPEMNVEL